MAKNILIRILKREKVELKSYLGTPVYDQVVFVHGKYKEGTDIISYDGLVIQSALLEVSQTKNIVTTAIQGRDGTVKEYVSDGDYAITLTGIIIGQSNYDEKRKTGTIEDIGNVYPQADVDKLIKICKVSDAVKISSVFLSLFGITDVVITDYSLPQREASRNMQPFEISMLSDKIIKL